VRHHHRITWQSYTPDGRSLDVMRTSSGWVATCDGIRGHGTSAAEAIRAALGDSGPSIGVSSASVESWLAEHAALLELEGDLRADD
jgi:hypothetical protein